MASAALLDLDNTLVKHGTNDLFPGVLEFLRWIKENGHYLCFTTMRGPDYRVGSGYSQCETEKWLKSLDIRYDAILWHCPSPRIVINDDGAFALDVNPETGVDIEKAKALISGAKEVHQMYRQQGGVPFELPENTTYTGSWPASEDDLWKDICQINLPSGRNIHFGYFGEETRFIIRGGKDLNNPSVTMYAVSIGEAEIKMALTIQALMGEHN